MRMGILIDEEGTKRINELVQWTGENPYNLIHKAIKTLHNAYLQFQEDEHV